MGPATQLGLAQALAFTDLRLWVGEHFNPRLDRISMMHSVEARVPFQDDQLVDRFAWTDPRLNLSKNSGKRLLRQAFRDRLSPDILGRPKRPFQAPGAALVRDGLEGSLLDLLAPHRLQRFGALDPAATEVVVQNALARGQSYQLWTLIALQLWCEAVLVPAPPAVRV
jgi:asparagine synthase (glutamine-hydrolysing)